MSEYALTSINVDDSTFASETDTAAGDKTVIEYIKNCILYGGNDQYIFKILIK